MKEIKKEEREACDALVFGLFMECMDYDSEQIAEEDAAVNEFCEALNCEANSPMAIAYRAFRLGLSKGIELVGRVEAIAENDRMVMEAY